MSASYSDESEFTRLGVREYGIIFAMKKIITGTIIAVTAIVGFADELVSSPTNSIASFASFRKASANAEANQNNETRRPEMTIYDFTAKGRNGAPLDLSTLRGKVLLVVNTATGCGFTPQYEGLEKLYSKYHGKGLEILDFPCDQFGHQAPGSDDEIHQFCTLKYNTSFDQLAKIEVNGNGADPIFKFLKSARPKDDVSEAEIKKLRDLLAKYNLTGAQEPGDIEWNFTKFLIDRNGNVIKRFHPTTKPEAINAEIVPLL